MVALAPIAPPLAEPDTTIVAGHLAQEALGAWSVCQLARTMIALGRVAEAGQIIGFLESSEARRPAPIARFLARQRHGLHGGHAVLTALQA